MRLRLVMLLLLAACLMAGAASCGGSGALDHPAWVKAVDTACTRANAKARQATTARAFGRALTAEAAALTSLHPAAAADLTVQEAIAHQMRTAGNVDTLTQPTTDDVVRGVDARAAFRFGALAANLAPCAVDPALLAGSPQSARDGEATATADRWLCNSADDLTPQQRHGVVSLTDRFIHEEAAAPQTAIQYQPWIQKGHPPESLWFILTDDYNLLTTVCPVTLSEVTLESTMRSVLDRQPIQVHGDTPAAAFLRYLNETRQANIDFFRTDQILEGTNVPGSGTLMHAKQYAALRRSLTADLRQLAHVAPPAQIRVGHTALVRAMTLGLQFEEEFAESLKPSSNVRGVVMQAILTHAEHARDVWFATVAALVSKYNLLPPSWAGPTPAQAASSR